MTKFKEQSDDHLDDDILVKREEIMRLFEPPLAKSTFHDRANRGEFASSKVPGYYLMNKTRTKLGMPQVNVSEYRKCLESTDVAEREKQLYHAALAITVPEAIEAGLPLQLPPALTFEESEQVLKKYKTLYALLDELKLSTRTERIAYVAGAIA